MLFSYNKLYYRSIITIGDIIHTHRSWPNLANF